MMATAFLLYGRIGVGKSTYAQSLAEHRRAVVFDGDRWVGRLYGRGEGAFADFEEVLGKVEAVMYNVWARCLLLHVNVVLDLGIWKRAKRDRVREQVTSLGASYELHEIVADPEIVWQRWRAEMPTRSCDRNQSHELRLIPRQGRTAVRRRTPHHGAGLTHPCSTRPITQPDICLVTRGMCIAGRQTMFRKPIRDRAGHQTRHPPPTNSV